MNEKLTQIQGHIKKQIKNKDIDLSLKVFNASIFISNNIISRLNNYITIDIFNYLSLYTNIQEEYNAIYNGYFPETM